MHFLIIISQIFNQINMGQLLINCYDEQLLQRCDENVTAHVILMTCKWSDIVQRVEWWEQI